jgi:L-histidine Nalpha-methyltransferase
MHANYQIFEVEKSESNNTDSFSLDVLEHFSNYPKRLPFKYHYDARGSRLFDQITELKEYYLTRCEQEILQQFKREMTQTMAPSSFFRLYELGAGNGQKTKELLRYFLEMGLTFEYAPIDCSQAAINQLVTSLREEFGDSLQVKGIIGEYFEALALLQDEKNHVKNIVLFLGSSIGNFDLEEAEHFLHHLWAVLKEGDDVFIGFDLKKDIAILEEAYNDSMGITREFNLNILDRINRELGGNFDRNKFIFHSFYNPAKGRVESWLISIESQMITIANLQKTFVLDAWEGIHVENSYKYNFKDIEELAKKTDFVIEKEFLDSKKYFAGTIWRIKKNSYDFGFTP